MKDYKSQLDKYLDYPENREQVINYLDKYWLEKKELNEVWLNVKNRIFNVNFRNLAEPVFNEQYEILIFKGGSVLPEDYFNAFLECVRISGDKSLIVLEDYDENNPPHESGPPFRLKYPTNITMEAIMSGADISKQVFIRPVRNYFVFGDSGHWGKYVGNDFIYPLEIIGFEEEYSDTFKGKLKIPEDDIEDLKDWTTFYGMNLPGVD
jgi:hypothetical protein